MTTEARRHGVSTEKCLGKSKTKSELLSCSSRSLCAASHSGNGRQAESRSGEYPALAVLRLFCCGGSSSSSKASNDSARKRCSSEVTREPLFQGEFDWLPDR